ncbi:hypothetical protein ASPCADRAFT_211059, partial [Aspergillus carbonarius ITEM 5010]
MSTTTTTTALTSTTLIGTLPAMASAAALVSGKTCPTCGQDGFIAAGQTADDSRRRVKDLEGEVNSLNIQATQMAEKLAVYEEEIRRLRSQPNSRDGSSISSTSSTQDRSLSPTQLLTSPKSQPGRLSTLASFLPSRRPSATSSTQAQSVVSSPPPPPPPQNTSHEETVELQNALDREQSLRKAAESQLSQASTELEEL